MRPERPVFCAVGRLTRVGLLPRLLEVFFNISLLLRGRVLGERRLQPRSYTRTCAW